MVKDEVYEVQGNTESCNDNLPDGKFKFKVTQTKGETNNYGSPCTRVWLEFEDGVKTDQLCREPKHDWRWKQFLYAIGIRRKPKEGEVFYQVQASDLVGKEGIAERKTEGGYCNMKRYYAIDDKPAQIAGVSAEETVKTVDTKVEKPVEETKKVEDDL